MKKVVLFLVVAVAIVTVGALAFGTGKEQLVFAKGYLSDVACATSASGKAGDGTVMKTDPDKHTVACMMAAPCAASGYGVMINEGTATAKNYVFYKFDQNGNDMAAKILKKTKKKSGVMVEVKGMKEMGMISVRSLKEVKK